MRGHACACPFLDLAGEKFNLFSSAQMKIYAAKYVSSWLLLQEVRKQMYLCSKNGNGYL